jgi:copper chaperone CopZ
MGSKPGNLWLYDTVQKKEKPMTREITPPTTTVTFAVEGMNCNSCVHHVEEALNENFKSVDHQIDLAGKKLMVTFQDGITPEAIAKVMGEAGYPVTRL